MQKCGTAGSRCPRCASLSVRSGPAQLNPTLAAVPVRSVPSDDGGDFFVLL